MNEPKRKRQYHKKSVHKRLEAMKEHYDAKMYWLADEIRKELVIPFCDLNGYRFVAGNGTWSFYSRRRDGRWKSFGNYWDDGKGVPTNVYQALTEMTIYNHEIGIWVEDYDPLTPMTIKE